MRELKISIDDEAGTLRFGAALAAVLEAGSVVVLNGPLGAGKTRVVKGVAAAVGLDPADITSPTYVLIHEYPSPTPIFHFDAYRIADDDEFLELGPDEYFFGSGWTFVEWGERVARCLPAERLEVSIEVLSETARGMDLRAIGNRYEDMLERLVRQLASSE